MKLSVRILLFILIPILLLPVALVKMTGPLMCLYILILMAAFWALDVLPYGVTSLLPILFAPLMGFETSQAISQLYSSDSLILCLGRLILACAFQRQQIHRRFGLFLITKLGPQPRMVMLSCMLPSYVLTMFISNTATAPIMLEFVIEVLEEMKEIVEGKELDYPTISNSRINARQYGTLDNVNTSLISQGRTLTRITESIKMNDDYPSMTNVVEKLKEIECKNLSRSIKDNQEPNNDFGKFSLALSLGTGYAASSGAVATLVACGPNLILLGLLIKEGYSQAINYGTFMAVGLPLSIVTFLITWIWVGVVNIGPKKFFAIRENTKEENEFLNKMQKAKDDLGKMTFAEFSCIFLTGIVIILWITRRLTAGVGWGYLFREKDKPDSQYVTDATPMVLIIILLYIWPAHCKFWKVNQTDDPSSERLLTWDTTHKNLPWAIVFLLGTGFAIKDICQKSGFSDVVADYLLKVKSIGPGPLMIICSILSCFTTEFLSSTTILPVYISIFLNLACLMQVHPFYFIFPLTLSSSFAFCLPAATTPNIAIFNRGLATTKQMIKTGLLMDIVFIFIVSAFMYAIAYPTFNMGSVPKWFIHCNSTK